MHLGVNSGLYSKLLHRMAESNMIVYYEPRDDVIENSLFGGGRKLGLASDLFGAGTDATPCSDPRPVMWSRRLSVFSLTYTYHSVNVSTSLVATYCNITSVSRPRTFSYCFWNFPGFSQVRSAALLGQSTFCPTSNAF